MRLNQKQLLSAGDMSTSSLNSIGLDLNQQVVGSISAVFSGSPVGTLVLEISNDIVQPASSANAPIASDPAANVVNWTTYSGSSVSVSSNGTFTWNLNDIGYRWIRVKYTKVSGTGSLDIYATTKGV